MNYGYERLKLAQLLGQLGIFLTAPVGVIGNAPSIKISVFQSSSLQVVPISPNASYVGSGRTAASETQSKGTESPSGAGKKWMRGGAKRADPAHEAADQLHVLLRLEEGLQRLGLRGVPACARGGDGAGGWEGEGGCTRGKGRPRTVGRQGVSKNRSGGEGGRARALMDQVLREEQHAAHTRLHRHCFTRPTLGAACGLWWWWCW